MILDIQTFPDSICQNQIQMGVITLKCNLWHYLSGNLLEI